MLGRKSGGTAVVTAAGGTAAATVATIVGAAATAASEPTRPPARTADLKPRSAPENPGELPEARRWTSKASEGL